MEIGFYGEKAKFIFLYSKPFKAGESKKDEILGASLLEKRTRKIDGDEGKME